MTQSSSYPPAVEVSSARAAATQGSAASTAGSAPHLASSLPAPAAVISAEPLDMVGLLAGAHHPGAGAVVLFSGEVRNSNKGQEVRFLEYEAWLPMATKLIDEILAEAK